MLKSILTHKAETKIMTETKTAKAKEYRLKRTLFGRFVLQVKEIRHHSRDLHGSGYYDEWDTVHWRRATMQEAAESGFEIA